MSSNAAPVTRLSTLNLFAAAFLSAPVGVAAQDGDGVTDEEAAQEAPPPDTPDSEYDDTRINILITVPRGAVNQAQVQACEDRAEAGKISGEIIVCRQLGEDPANLYSGTREEARKRYAEETAFKGDPRTPDVAGGGIFRGPASVSGACLIPPCPDEPALFIDVEALPEAPEGSDADRIARGLPPLGEDDLTPEEIAERRKALGLEAPPLPSKDD